MRRQLVVLLLLSFATWPALPASDSQPDSPFLKEARAAAAEEGDVALQRLVGARRLASIDGTVKLLRSEDSEDLKLAARIAEAYEESFEDDSLVRWVRTLEGWSEEQRASRAEATQAKEVADEARREGRIEEALEGYLSVLDRLERLGDRPSRVNMLIGIAAFHFDQDGLSECVEWLDRARHAADEAGYLSTEDQIGYYRAWVLSRRGEHEQAGELGLEAMAIARESGDRGSEALLENLLGSVAFDLGDMEAAKKHFLAAIAIAEEDGTPQRYSPWANLAMVYGRLSDTGAQAAALQRAMEASRADGSHSTTANLAMHLSTLEWNRGDRSRAWEWMDQAEQAAAASGHADLQAETEIHKAQFALGTSEFQKTLEHLDRAEKLAAGLESSALTGFIHRVRCLARFHLGDYEAAFADALEALRFFEAAGRLTHAADAHRVLAALYVKVAEFETALRHAKASLEIYEQLGDVAGRADVLGVLGVLHVHVGDHAAAREALLEALGIWDPEHSPLSHAEVLVNLAGLELADGEDRWDTALGYLERVRQIGKQVDYPYFVAYGGLYEVELRVRRGEHEAARRALEQIRELDADSLYPEAKFQVYLVEGRVHEAEGNLEAAVASFRRSVEEVERLRSGVQDVPWQAALLEDRIEPYRKLFRLHMERDAIEDAYLIARMAKSRSFVERLDPVATDDFSDVPGFSFGPLTPAEIAPVSSIRAALRKGEILLDLFVEPDEVTVFVLSSDKFSLKHIRLDREELIDLVEAVRHPGKPAPTEEAAVQAFETAAKRLGKLLLDPLAKELDSTERLFVIPNGELHHTPFAALYYEGTPLVQKCAVAVLPAAELLLSARRRPASGSGSPLVVGDPAAGSDFARLPGANREAREVAGILGRSSVLMLGVKAGEAATRSRAKGARVIHLAAHARVDPVAPAKSFVALAPGSGQDGRWTAEEIAETEIEASLVTLSGCKTALEAGLGKSLAPADEREGLVRAFFKAGAGTVVANLWEVDDAVGQSVLPELYRRMAKAGPVEALTLLQRDMLRGSFKGPGGRPLAHPFYWAGLVAYGAEARRTVRSPSR